MKTLSDELVSKGLASAAQLTKQLTQSKPKNTEKLSARDLAELMGTNRDTYRRGTGGAIRRK